MNDEKLSPRDLRLLILQTFVAYERQHDLPAESMETFVQIATKLYAIAPPGLTERELVNRASLAAVEVVREMLKP